MSIIQQEWKNLLFLHWKCDEGEIKKTLPPGLFVDTFNGYGYLSLVFFQMQNISVGIFPSVPGFSTFIEANMRTYVLNQRGVPGIWFYSLDINSFFAAKLAKHLFYLPYFFANLNTYVEKNIYHVVGKRNDTPKVEMQISYKEKQEDIHFAKEKTVEYFLIERYKYFTYRDSQLYLGEVSHKPYPIKEVELLNCKQTFLQNSPFKFLDRVNNPDYIHFSPGVEVDITHLKKDT